MADTGGDMARQCEAMTNRDLVRALTADRGKYAPPFQRAVHSELERREIALDQFVDFAWVGRPQGNRQRCDILEALEVLEEEMPLWRLYLFGNCLDDALILQRERFQWAIHLYVEEEYRNSHFVATRDRLRQLLERFLRLESWTDLAGAGENLDDWEVFEHSPSREQIDQLATELNEGGIPNTVKTPTISNDEEEAFTLLVPADRLDEADRVVTNYEDELNTLYEQAMAMAAGADPRVELEVYEQLVEAAPSAPVVFYNRGNLLLEQGRHEEAAASLIEAVSLGMQEVQARFQPGAGQAGGGGLLGVLVTLFKKSFIDDDKGPPSYPDYIDDTEMQLQSLLQLLPRNTKIIHCLASICRLRHDAEAAAAHYERILTADPEDRIARFYLDYLRATGNGSDLLAELGETRLPERGTR